MSTFRKTLVASSLCLIAISASQATVAQSLTPEDWFERFNNGLPGEDARQPGSNSSDVSFCKEFMDENPGVFENLGKCANMTPADLQFLCRNVIVQDLMLTESKGECVKVMMSFMSEKKRSA